MQWVPVHMSHRSIGRTLAYELHLFGRLCATLKVTKTDRIIFLLLDAVSLWYCVSVCLILHGHGPDHDAQEQSTTLSSLLGDQVGALTGKPWDILTPEDFGGIFSK